MRLGWKRLGSRGRGKGRGVVAAGACGGAAGTDGRRRLGGGTHGAERGRETKWRAPTLALAATWETWERRGNTADAVEHAREQSGRRAGRRLWSSMETTARLLACLRPSPLDQPPLPFDWCRLRPAFAAHGTWIWNTPDALTGARMALAYKWPCDSNPTHDGTNGDVDQLIALYGGRF